MQAGKSGNQPDKQFFQPGTGGELTEPDEILCSDSSFQGNRAEKPAPKALVKPALFVLPPGPKKSQDPRSAQFRSSCKRLSTFRKDVGENVQVCTVRLSVRFHTGPSIAPPASHGYEVASRAIFGILAPARTLVCAKLLRGVSQKTLLLSHRLLAEDGSHSRQVA